MADTSETNGLESVPHKVHRGDAVATKAAKKVDQYHPPKPDQPAGGFDDTPVPRAPPGYTVKITFHRANNLPFADFGSFSADPYLLAQLNTSQPTRHKQDPKLRFRTHTVRKNVDPEWNCDWIVANVPASGFQLKARLYDEDPADHDDRLGNVHVHVSHIDEQWEGISEKAYKIKKRMGSKRAYFFRGCASLLNKDVHMSGDLIVSVKVLGRTEGDNGGRVYTVGPCTWRRHYSPLFGRLVGTKDPESVGKDGRKQERYNFQANQIQLQGPTPDEMYHRYVEFKPFVKGMFTGTSLRGSILNRALHHQHARIYNFDRTTITGTFDHPSEEMTKQFLDLAHWDKGGRIFTYVITLDGQMRFTETGKEFGIDMLSKHTMHADCDNWISFSGEFFIRRLKKPWTGSHHHGAHSRTVSAQSGLSFGAASGSSGMPTPLHSPALNGNNNNNSNEESPDHDPTHLAPHQASQPQQTQDSNPEKPQSSPLSSSNDTTPTDPAYYHLIIDNDSGTYRPNAKLLPLLRRFLSEQFPGLRISTLDCQADADKMARLKNEQRERKKKEGGGKRVAYVQVDSSDEDSSSISSSDEEELDRRIGEEGGGSKKGKGKGKGKVGGVLHALSEPKDAVLSWAQGADHDEEKKGGDEEKGAMEKKWEQHEEKKADKRARVKREGEEDAELVAKENATTNGVGNGHGNGHVVDDEKADSHGMTNGRVELP